MKTIPISDIIVKDRQRKKFTPAAMESLRNSILNRGLLHPIAIDRSNVLCIGERRLRAVEEIWEGELPEGTVRSIFHDGEEVPSSHIPYTLVDPEDLHEHKATELEENLAREDLTWQEEAEAIAELHMLKATSQTSKRWTMADTATLIAGEEETTPAVQKKVSDSLILAEHLDDPLVAAAKDKKQAMKAIKDKKQTERRIEANEKFDRSSSPHTLLQSSCFDLKWEPIPKFDVIITDPPYGRDMHKMGASFDGEEHEYDDSMANFEFISNNLPRLATECTGPQAHCYVFCDIRRWPTLFESFVLSGWHVWPKPLIWFKGNIGHFPNVELGPRGTYEAILYAIKGEKRVEKVAPDVICVNQSTKTLHPANKPAELYAELLSRSTIPGQRVVDFFCGSGPIFPASNKLGLVATGVEINPKYAAMALSRINEEIT